LRGGGSSREAKKTMSQRGNEKHGKTGKNGTKVGVRRKES